METLYQMENLVRTPPLGLDRRFNRYFLFAEGKQPRQKLRLLVECSLGSAAALRLAPSPSAITYLCCRGALPSGDPANGLGALVREAHRRADLWVERCSGRLVRLAWVRGLDHHPCLAVGCAWRRLRVVHAAF